MNKIYKVSTHLIEKGKLNELSSREFTDLQKAYDYADQLMEENFKYSREMIRYEDGNSYQQHINRDTNQWIGIRVENINISSSKEYTPISMICQIGKSKKEVNVIFLAKDFKRIEDLKLYLHNDEREFKLDTDRVWEIFQQLKSL